MPFGIALAETPQSIAKIFPKAQISATIDERNMVSLAGHRHPALDNSLDKGAVKDTMPLKQIILILQSSPEQQTALEQFSIAQQSIGTPEYHKWLTPQEFEDHFGVAKADLTLVKNYLTDHGFIIEEVPVGGRMIVFSGTAAKVKQTFKTEIHQYDWKGEKHIANSTDPQIPVALKNIISGFASLHDFHSRPQSFKVSSPNFTSGGGHFLAPEDMANIYNLNPLYANAIKGQGVNIAILGRTGINTTDMSTFRSHFGLTANPPQILPANNTTPVSSGDQGESDLDLEWAGAVAPQANLKFVTTANTGLADGVLLSAVYAVQNNIADVISLSYGSCEFSLESSNSIVQGRFYNDNNLWNSLWQQASTQGSTVLVSSGDSGAAGCDTSNSATASGGLGVNGLCSSPYSTCVGGTQFNDSNNSSQYWSSANSSNSGSALGYIPEDVWNSSGSAGGSQLWATGGGVSILYSKPSWQVAPGLPTTTNARYVPDVALNAAAHTPYMVYSSDNSGNSTTLAYYYGTSAAAPSFAGIVALVVQQNGGRQGNINPKLYQMSLQQANGIINVFNRTVSGNNSVPGVAAIAAASADGKSYNASTGLGSVNANLLVRNWNPKNWNTQSLAKAFMPIYASLFMELDDSISISSSANNISAAQLINLTATVSGLSAGAGGTIQFYSNGSALGAPVAVASGSATLSTNALSAVGSYAITAQYTGDTNYAPSTSLPTTVNVLSTSTITISSNLATLSVGNSVTLTATVIGNNPSGTVQFFVNGTAFGTPVKLSAGMATLNTSSLSMGSDQITASYSGDNNNLTSTTASALTELVTLPPTSATVPTISESGLLVLGSLLLTLMFWSKSKDQNS